jgi:hypothetical protein
MGDASIYGHSPNLSGAQTMTKLINTYRKLPTMANRDKLQRYLDKHMMAVCMATVEEIAFLRVNEFKGV